MLCFLEMHILNYSIVVQNDSVLGLATWKKQQLGDLENKLSRSWFTALSKIKAKTPATNSPSRSRLPTPQRCRPQQIWDRKREVQHNGFVGWRRNHWNAWFRYIESIITKPLVLSKTPGLCSMQCFPLFLKYTHMKPAQLRASHVFPDLSETNVLWLTTLLCSRIPLRFSSNSLQTTTGHIFRLGITYENQLRFRKTYKSIPNKNQKTPEPWVLGRQSASTCWD